MNTHGMVVSKSHTRSNGCGHHQRKCTLATMQKMILPGSDSTFSKGNVGKAAKHKVHNRTKSFLSGSKGSPEHGCLSNGCVDYSVFTEFLYQSFGMWKYPSTYILPYHYNLFIQPHFLSNSFFDCCYQCELSHLGYS